MVLSLLFFKEMAGEAIDICLPVLKESNKSRFDSNSVKNSVLNISHIIFGIVACTFFLTTFLEIAVCISSFQKHMGLYASYLSYSYLKVQELYFSR